MESDEKSQRGVFDLPKKMPAGKKLASQKVEWKKVALVGVLTAVILACTLGLIR